METLFALIFVGLWLITWRTYPDATWPWFLLALAFFVHASRFNPQRQRAGAGGDSDGCDIGDSGDSWGDSSGDGGGDGGGSGD